MSNITIIEQNNPSHVVVVPFSLLDESGNVITSYHVGEFISLYRTGVSSLVIGESTGTRINLSSSYVSQLLGKVTTAEYFIENATIDEEIGLLTVTESLMESVRIDRLDESCSNLTDIKVARIV